PKVRIWVLAFGRIPLRLPAAIPLLVWFAYQIVAVALVSDEDISWAAHVGGFVAGAILVLFLRRRGVPLFDRAIVTPKSVETEAPRVTAQGAGGTEPPSWGRG
ncbi:MAG: rhomboid family intramembrane serine protease, partial [Oricola sp.]|nr:rhomboid family intramembrane serine protease [Oricola sp.]